MPAHDAQLVRREDVALGTTAFRFTRPAGFEFTAGQSISLALVDPPHTDAKGNTRTFSIASAPFEGELEIATRMRDSAFKRSLATLVPGAPVRIRGPGGKFILGDDPTRTAVLMAGGIGITPFMSMLRQAAHDASPRPIVLLYSNRRPEDAPFLEELTGLLTRIPNARLVATMTDMEQSSRAWNGEHGLIDGAFLERHLQGTANPLHYIAGPPPMVEALKKALTARGVAADAIRTDLFLGY